MMKRHLPVIFFAGAVILLCGNLALAHHAESAEFDVNKPVKVTGVLAKVEWMNPHIWFYLDVKDASGKVERWGFSGLPPSVLVRKGITKASLKIGDVLTAEGSRAKDGSTNASAGDVTFPNGEKVLVGASGLRQ
jgi:hypothetical protein